MARRFDPDSATTEFFINLADNKHLNHYKPEAAYMGYCVFGRVVQGMDVVEKIGHVPTRGVGNLKELPEQNIVIEKAAVLDTPVVLAQQEKKPSVLPAAKISKPLKKGKKRG